LRYWWVNQNQTYKHEVAGGFLWSPKQNKDGGRNQFYDNMTDVTKGDLVFSFCDTLIKAIGVATGPAVSSDKPDFGAAGGNWGNEGWLVPVEFEEAEAPIRPKDIIKKIRPYLADKYAPLQSNGNGNQGVYLAEISDQLAQVLLNHLGSNPPRVSLGAADASYDDAEKEEENLKGRTDIGDTKKEQLIMARRGQGIFKANVRLNEKYCRVTGVSDIRFLIASHIKPWSKSDDGEKLDGCNGLLLTPHVDRLFDRGFISFTDAGEVLVSPQVPSGLLGAFGIDPAANVGSFSAHQARYLAWHRKFLLKNGK
jgi:putative restriction endonuclease